MTYINLLPTPIKNFESQCLKTLPNTQQYSGNGNKVNKIRIYAHLYKIAPPYLGTYMSENVHKFY